MKTNVENEIKRIQVLLPDLNDDVFNILKLTPDFDKKSGEVIKNIYFLIDLFYRYGLTRDHLTKYLNNNPYFIITNAHQLLNKLAVLNLAGLAEKLLFCTPYRLLDTESKDAKVIYAIINYCSEIGVNIDYYSLFNSYDESLIKNMIEYYPLDKKTLRKIKKLYLDNLEKNKDIVKSHTIHIGDAVKYSYTLKSANYHSVSNFN